MLWMIWGFCSILNGLDWNHSRLSAKLYLDGLISKRLCSIHSICQIITWQKGFLCHRSTTLEFTTSLYLKFEFFTNFLFQAQNTPLQNCIPSLGSFPSPWTVYPDFDSCYSHFMPYRMTPSVRHRAIEVHYYYYYYYYKWLLRLAQDFSGDIASLWLDEKSRVSLKVGCLPYAVGVQPSIPLINPGRK